MKYCLAQGYTIEASYQDGPDQEVAEDGLHRLVEHHRHAGEGATIIVRSLTLLGPTPRLALRAHIALRAGGITVESASSDSGSELLRTVLAELAEQSPDRGVGDRVRDAMRRKAVKGEVLGRPPYGYRAGPRHRLEIVSEEAAVVRRIFGMYVNDGLGIRLIAQRLNAEEIRTRRGNDWSMVTIRDILRNRAYLGTYQRFGVRVPGSHPPIIAADEFRRAGERMTLRRTGGGPRTVSPFLLSGLAHCAACGGNMIGVSRRQTWTRRGDGGTSSAEYRYYQCGSRTNRSVCSYHTHRAAELEERARFAVLNTLERDLTAEQAEPAPRSNGEAETLRGRLRVLDRAFDRLLDRAAVGEVGIERFPTAAADTARRHLLAEHALWNIERRGRERATREVAVQRLRDEWNDLPFEDRQALLRELLERIDIGDDTVTPVLRV